MGAYNQFKQAIDLEEGEIVTTFEDIVKEHRLESNGRSDTSLSDLLIEFFNCVMTPSRERYNDFIEMYSTSNPDEDYAKEREYERSYLKMNRDMKRQIIGAEI